MRRLAAAVLIALSATLSAPAVAAQAARPPDEKALMKALTRAQRKQIEKISASLDDEKMSAAQVQSAFRALVADIASRKGSLLRLEKLYGSRAAAADGLIAYLGAPAGRSSAREASDREAFARRLEEFQRALEAERERLADALSPGAGARPVWPLVVPDTLDRLKVDIDRLHHRIARRKVRADGKTEEAPFLGPYRFGRSLTTPQEALAFLQNLGFVQKRVAAAAGEQLEFLSGPSERPDAAKDLLAALRADALDAFVTNHP